MLKGHEQANGEVENLRLQLAQKTSKLKQEENRMLKLELLLKTKEMESLQKENEELKAENEQLRKNVSFLCGSVYLNHAVYIINITGTLEIHA